MEVPARASAAEAREGEGAVPLYNLMEDATTAEISRAQLWQWQRFAAPLDDGRELTPGLLEALIAEELLDLDERRFRRSRSCSALWSSRSGSRST